MHVIEVIPLVSLPPQVPQLLSYYYDSDIPRGAIVEVAVNKRKIPSVVLSSSSLEKNKILLKSSAFQLKKISSVISLEPVLRDLDLKLASWLSKNYFTSPGTSLKTLLPYFFGKNKYPFAYPSVVTSGDRVVPEMISVNAGDVWDRIRTDIKHVISGGWQVLMLVPDTAVAKNFYEKLAGYYDTSLVTGKMGLKTTYSTWKKISSGETDIVVGTRQALFSPFSKLKLIIVEDPFNIAYKSDMSPKYNSSDLAIKIAELHGAKILFISPIPDIGAYFRSTQGKLKLKEKILSKPVTIVSDISREKREGNFSIFSRELKKEILEHAEKGKKILLFSSRKGYASNYLCENCGYNFKCKKCSIPLKVYKLSESMLICSRCSFHQKLPQFCPNCNSHKLRSAGYIGSEKINEELGRLFDGKFKPPVFMIDSETQDKEVSAALNNMSESGSCICIATQALFSYRFGLRFDLTGMINFDGLTSVPDFKADEEIIYYFEKLNDFKPGKIFIQTFNPDNPLLETLKKRDYKGFYQKELGIRNIFFYPPFSRLVKLSYLSADKNKAFYEARVLSEKLRMVVAQKRLESKVKLMDPSPAFVERQKGKYVYNLILKILPELDPGEIVRYVPSGWSIDIDPRSIL